MFALQVLTGSYSCESYRAHDLQGLLGTPPSGPFSMSAAAKGRFQRSQGSAGNFPIVRPDLVLPSPKDPIVATSSAQSRPLFGFTDAQGYPGYIMVDLDRNSTSHPGRVLTPPMSHRSFFPTHVVLLAIAMIVRRLAACGGAGRWQTRRSGNTDNILRRWGR